MINIELNQAHDIRRIANALEEIKNHQTETPFNVDKLIVEIMVSLKGEEQVLAKQQEAEDDHQRTEGWIWALEFVLARINEIKRKT